MNDTTETIVIPVEFDDGTIMYMQAIADGSALGSRRTLASAGEELSGKFRSVTDAVRNIAKQITEAVADARPTETTVEFGLDVKVEPAGIAALMVKGDASASLKITLTWSKEPSP